MGAGPDGHHVDWYQLVCFEGEHVLDLYMDLYHEGESGLIPDGLTKSTVEGFGMPGRVNGFPEELLEIMRESRGIS